MFTLSFLLAHKWNSSNVAANNYVDIFIFRSLLSLDGFPNIIIVMIKVFLKAESLP